MLIEVKTKVAYIIDGKTKKKTETFILNKEVFAEAEFEVMNLLNIQVEGSTTESYEIQGLKLSSIKEIITQYTGDHSYIASLKDTYTDEVGNDKIIKYKVLLWADNITEAMAHTREIALQGYDMVIDGLKEVDYQFLTDTEDEQTSED